MDYLKTFLPYLFGNKKGKSLEVPLPHPILWETLNFEETLMFHTISNSLNQYISTLDLKDLKLADVFHLLNFKNFFDQKNRAVIDELFKKENQFYQEAINAKALSQSDLQSLINFNTNKLTVFALLKSDRARPGKLLVRDESGKFLRDNKGHIWSIPILGLSGRGLTFNHSNGCTPAGVYTIDSVMPEANKCNVFGKYRRPIVNFIPKSAGEGELLKWLPDNFVGLSWWKQSVVGRDLGRHLFRIHGTGRKNLKIFSPYFPFVPTSGCLATNEANILGIKQFKDQRLLLDILMAALKLPITFENESKIHGLLYVVEFDDNLSTLSF